MEEADINNRILPVGFTLAGRRRTVNHIGPLCLLLLTLFLVGRPQTSSGSPAIVVCSLLSPERPGSGDDSRGHGIYRHRIG
jgi:hypothetical protein